MEAATTAAERTPLQRRVIERAQLWIDRYGLIVVLLILPVVYGVQDLQDDGQPLAGSPATSRTGSPTARSGR